MLSQFIKSEDLRSTMLLVAAESVILDVSRGIKNEKKQFYMYVSLNVGSVYAKRFNQWFKCVRDHHVTNA